MMFRLLFNCSRQNMKYENKTLHATNIIMIAAVDDDMGIGRNGVIPWNVPEDRAFFKQQTMGHPLLVGRKTFESLGAHPLPGRAMGVLTHVPILGVPYAGQMQINQAFVWSDSLDHLIRWAAAFEQPIFAAGGAQLYEQILPLADQILLSRISGSFECDVKFPPIPAAFRCVSKNWQSSFLLEKYIRISG